MEKVYCSECKWLESGFVCKCLDNLNDDWYAPNHGNLLHAAQKNERNNCKDYEAKVEAK